MNIHGVYATKKKKGRKISYKSNRIRCITINSHVNSSESNHLNTSNSNNVIGNSNLPCINVQTKRPFSTLVNLQTETDTASSISFNNETLDERYISEEILFHQNSEELIEHKCDYNGNFVLNTSDTISIDLINVTNYISMKYDDNLIHKYYALFYHQRITQIYPLDNNDT